MNMQRENLVLLDLEETVMDNWFNGLFLPTRVEKMKEHEAFQSLTELGLMSWAVHDMSDKDEFNRRFKDDLEHMLEHEFKFVFDMRQWALEVMRCSGLHVEVKEMFDTFKKQDVLFTLARNPNSFLSNKNVTLFDDMVEHNLVVDVPSNNCRVTLVNVKEL